MRGDRIIRNQLLMAQAFNALADTITHSKGSALTPTAFASLPVPAAAGMIMCINDSAVTGWGSVVTGGGFNSVIAWYNGADWKVIGA